MQHRCCAGRICGGDDSTPGGRGHGRCISLEGLRQHPPREKSTVPRQLQSEQVRGKIHFAIDPKIEANSRVIDLDLAPCNGGGRVEFSADLAATFVNR